MCKDGKYLNVAVGSERIWERFCQGTCRQDLKDHPDYATNEVRVRNRMSWCPCSKSSF